MHDGDMHGMPDDMQQNAGSASDEYYLQDTVNFFSGVRSINE